MHMSRGQERPESSGPMAAKDPLLKESTGGEFRVYRASMRLLQGS